MAPELEIQREEQSAISDWLRIKWERVRLVVSGLTGIYKELIDVFEVDGEPLVLYGDKGDHRGENKLLCSKKLAEELKSAGIIKTEAEVTKS